MKKTLIMMLLAVAAQDINAQLAIDSVGRVGIGYNVIPNYPLTVSSYNYTTNTTDFKYAASFKGKHNGIFIDNGGTPYDDNTYFTGLRVSNLGSSNKVYGVYSTSVGSGTGDVMCGVMGQSSDSETLNIGVLGAKAGSSKKGAGIYGISDFYNYADIPSSYSDSYAGFFNGKVRVINGSIYATVLSPSTSSSPTGQGEIGENVAMILSERGESVTDKLSQVQALQFQRYEPESVVAKDSPASDTADIDYENLTPEEIEAMTEEKEGEGPKSNLSPIQYGLDAEQLKAVYPELVYEDENGNVSINYVEMVPLLVQSINELSQELAELKGTTAKKAKTKTKAKAETTSIEETASEVDMVRMDQNKPNPFSESTVITLNIPKATQTANIFIFDMSGKQVKGIPVGERGETNITVYASDLTAGMYIYTLVVDGKVKVTRKMIVSEV